MDTELIVFALVIILILGAIFYKDKFTGLFRNPFYQSPDVQWKGIDQNLFENPDFKIPASDLPPTSCNCNGKKEKMCGCQVNGMMDWNNLPQS